MQQVQNFANTFHGSYSSFSTKYSNYRIVAWFRLCNIHSRAIHFLEISKSNLLIRRTHANTRAHLALAARQRAFRRCSLIGEAIRKQRKFISMPVRTQFSALCLWVSNYIKGSVYACTQNLENRVDRWKTSSTFW